MVHETDATRAIRAKHRFTSSKPAPFSMSGFGSCLTDAFIAALEKPVWPCSGGPQPLAGKTVFFRPLPGDRIINVGGAESAYSIWETMFDDRTSNLLAHGRSHRPRSVSLGISELKETLEHRHARRWLEQFGKDITAAAAERARKAAK